MFKIGFWRLLKKRLQLFFGSIRRLLRAGGLPSSPTKPAVVVGFAAGGPDVVARAFADHAARALGQPFVVENKPGANTILAAQAVASARPTATRCCSAPPTTP